MVVDQKFFRVNTPKFFRVFTPKNQLQHQTRFGGAPNPFRLCTKTFGYAPNPFRLCTKPVSVMHQQWCGSPPKRVWCITETGLVHNRNGFGAPPKRVWCITESFGAPPKQFWWRTETVLVLQLIFRCKNTEKFCASTKKKWIFIAKKIIPH